MSELLSYQKTNLLSFLMSALFPKFFLTHTSQLTSISSRLRLRRKSSYQAINGTNLNDYEMMSNIVRENNYTINHLNDQNNNNNRQNYTLQNLPVENHHNQFSRPRANTSNVYIFNQYFMATDFQRARANTMPNKETSFKTTL